KVLEKIKKEYKMGLFMICIKGQTKEMILRDIELAQEYFDEIALKSNKTVIIDFWAPWCNPCRALLPILDEVARETDEFIVGKVNVDVEKELAKRYKVRTVPSILVFKLGMLVKTSVGFISKEEIYDLVK
ncbi:thioredoxin, partial [Johnsonella ignava]|uniref:thioredoxin n=1 Tax=Johnsonella ignava TaxID=43995 RepID=UPI0023F37441